MCLQGMVCVTPEDRVCETAEARVQCIVHRIDASFQKEKYEGTFPASTPVVDLIKAVADKFQEDPALVRLTYQCPTGDMFEYSDDTEGTLGSIGLSTDYGARNSMILEVRGKRLQSRRRVVPRRARDAHDADMAARHLQSTRKAQQREENHEASSVSSPSTSSNPPPPPMAFDYSVPVEEAPKRSGRTSDETIERNLSPGYVGLVNQAMTCYLNSLLQALFMTPEFRNALYKWKFDPSLGASAQKCIPYQLQKLFLNLQTSSKTAVETTELTKSFGWESGEVWQQHDIQELCRVMFDALEHEFKNTEQADLINRLYQGKMIDYVKCLECGTEKSKEDVFLDIPLPVRPFGSTVAYKDIDEALKAFVLPETLNENNQYFCEACNKKCDAHKGLKFSKFPYLLTLHLKRFDFDYNIMHRIKLNDKVTFSEILDLNGFIQNCETPSEENLEVATKCDDSSTTDSALDEDTNHTVNEAPVFEADQEDDEGIDLSNNSNNSQENEKNISQSLSKGPFVYELYSIMIHSGSASGGHYYAYIKDFSRGEWYCFNDQSVTPITREDIIKTYGGGPHRMYYNGAHSSSTNAYMLMYRQIDRAQNCLAMTVDDFPPHIQKILDEIVESEEREKALKAKEEEMVKLKVYCDHPGASQKSIKIFIHNEDTWAEALTVAWKQLKLDSVIPEDQCRLVLYNTAREYFELSFEWREKCSIKDILRLTEQINSGINVRAEFFLETRDKDKKFFPYNVGDISMIVYLVDVENCDVTSSTFLRTSPCQTVEDLKGFLQEAIPLETKDIHIALARNKNVTYVSEKDRHDASRPLNKAGFFSENRVFITPVTPEDGDMCANFEKSKFFRCVSELKNVILLQLSLPENLEDQCDSLLIPLLDDKNDPTKEETTSDGGECNPRLNGVEEELAYSGASGTSDQSASEDSSLTDSERTIIGDTEVGTNDGRVSSGSDSEQLFSPVQATPNLPQSEEESTTFFWNPDINSSSSPKPTPQNLYFRAEIITEVAGAPTPTGEQKMLKIAVDKSMDIETFKTKLERYVGVAGKYLKLLQSPDSRSEVMSFLQSKDNDKLAIGLTRHLEPDEFKAKLYYFNTNNVKNQSQTNPVELIICTAKTVGDTKKDIAKELAKKGWKVLVDRIRLRTKEWKSPGKILLDHVVWEEQVQQNTIELFFQNLDGPEKVTVNTFLVMFVRRWHPSTLTLGALSEVVIDHQNEFLKRLSEMSELPVENIEFVKGSSLFLSDINVLNVHDLDWTSNEEILVEWKKSSYGVALIVFYRDSREELKSLTKEEAEEMAQNEQSNHTSSSSPYISNYSPRKERALKIYWDNKSSNRIMDLD